jgi:hypothetical protein
LDRQGARRHSRTVSSTAIHRSSVSAVPLPC